MARAVPESLRKNSTVNASAFRGTCCHDTSTAILAQRMPYNPPHRRHLWSDMAKDARRSSRQGP